MPHENRPAWRPHRPALPSREECRPGGPENPEAQNITALVGFYKHRQSPLAEQHHGQHYSAYQLPSSRGWIQSWLYQ